MRRRTSTSITMTAALLTLPFLQTTPAFRISHVPDRTRSHKNTHFRKDAACQEGFARCKCIHERTAVTVDDENQEHCASFRLQPLTRSTDRRTWIDHIASCGAAIWGAYPLHAAATPTVAFPDSLATNERASQPLRDSTQSALCDPSVSSWRKGDRVVHLLGSAHISSYSAELAGRLVREVRPDAVFVELDKKRMRAALPGTRQYDFFLPSSYSPEQGNTGARNINKADLMVGSSSTPAAVFSAEETSKGMVGSSSTPAAVFSAEETSKGKTDDSYLQQWHNERGTLLALPSLFNPIESIQRGIFKAYSNTVGNAIKGLYKKLENAGFTPGEEFVVAVTEGLKLGSTIVLGDRDVDVTMGRLTAALANTDFEKLSAMDFDMQEVLKDQLPKSTQEYLESNTGEIDAEQLNALLEVTQKKENVKKLMSKFKDAAPLIYSAMVAERDEFMANGLDKLEQFHSIVAVMGVAHIDGVEKYLQSLGWKALRVKC